jgi:hypothetical protein
VGGQKPFRQEKAEGMPLGTPEILTSALAARGGFDHAKRCMRVTA